jgi:hypothetical protein
MPVSLVDTQSNSRLAFVVTDTSPVSVGAALNTTLPVPVAVLVPVPPLVTANVPLRFAAGYAVQFVKVPEIGVPRALDTRVMLE